ncbi:MAG TPA: alpha/beta hydrolase [Bacteroidia bacterium]|nr:alpha/beta hydrolase [Bacteroidia bacterium]
MLSCQINKIALAGLVLLLPWVTPLFAQNPSHSVRYTNANFFDIDNIVIKDSVVYGNAKNWLGNEDTLDMKIYYPDLAADSLKKRPLVVLIHGGSYFMGTKEDACNPACFLAKRGFVTASINYRLGWNSYMHRGNKWDSTFYMAIYRSVQDSKAAIRFLVSNASQYGIDTSKIFIGGISAGATTALYTAYYSQSTWDKDFPWLEKKLGSLDGSTNTLTNKYTLTGVFDICGGIGDTTDLVSADARRIAIMIFHGTADSVVSYSRPKSFEDSRMIPLYGGYLIAQRYNHLNGCYQLFTNPGGGHGQGFYSRLIADKIGVFCKNLFEGTCKPQEFTLEH